MLGPGTYRVAGDADSEADALTGDQIGNGVTVSQGYVRTEFFEGGFAYPDLTFSSDAIRATLGQRAVPEPGMAMIIGISIIAGCLQRRRVR